MGFHIIWKEKRIVFYVDYLGGWEILDLYLYDFLHKIADVILVRLIQFWKYFWVHVRKYLTQS